MNKYKERESEMGSSRDGTNELKEEKERFTGVIEGVKQEIQELETKKSELEKSVSVVEKESEVVPEMSVESSSSSDGSSVEFVPSDGGVNEKKALGMKLRHHRSKRVAREKGQSDDSTAYVSESSEGEEKKREAEKKKRDLGERRKSGRERRKRNVCVRKKRNA